MKSRVITLATSKGGTGKSTLVRSIASYLINLNMRVAVIDADPQASIISRHDSSGSLKNLIVIAEPEEQVASLIEEVRNDYNFIIVDTGGFRNRTTIQALISSDVAIIPLKASADDVAGAIDTYNLIQELNSTPERNANPIEYKMMLTMTQQHTVIAKHVRLELEQQGYLLLKSEMYHRVAYPEAAINGLSPSIIDPDGAAARDICKIMLELNYKLL